MVLCVFVWCGCFDGLVFCLLDFLGWLCLCYSLMFCVFYVHVLCLWYGMYVCMAGVFVCWMFVVVCI